MAPNHSTRLVGSLCRRSRTMAYTRASTAPTITVSSSTGSVQFSSPNGLRNSTNPPAVSHEKPRRSAKPEKVGVHRSDIGGGRFLLRGVAGGVPLRHLVALL